MKQKYGLRKNLGFDSNKGSMKKIEANPPVKQTKLKSHNFMTPIASTKPKSFKSPKQTYSANLTEKSTQFRRKKVKQTFADKVKNLKLDIPQVGNKPAFIPKANNPFNMSQISVAKSPTINSKKPLKTGPNPNKMTENQKIKSRRV